MASALGVRIPSPAPFNISSNMTKIYSLLILGCLALGTGCQQDIILGMTTDDLKFSRAWGEPHDTLKATEQIEIWHYVIYDIDHIIFIKNHEVVGQIRYGPQEKMWAITQRWVKHVKDNPVYQISINKYLDDIINQRLRLGMNQTEASLSWGNPVNVKRTQLRYGIREEWLYRRPVYSKTVLVFDNGVLTDWETIKQ